MFQAAQAAADQYLENIRRLSEEPEEKVREECREPASGPEAAEAPILNEGPAADEEVPGEQGRKGH